MRNDCHRVLTAVLGTACVVLTVGAGLASAQTTAKPASSTSKTASTVAKKPTTASKTSAARAQAASRARAAAVVHQQQQDAMTAHYKRDMLGNQVPDVRAAAAIIYNPPTNACSGNRTLTNSDRSRASPR